MWELLWMIYLFFRGCYINSFFLWLLFASHSRLGEELVVEIIELLLGDVPAMELITEGTDIEGKPHNFKDIDISTDSDVNWCKYVKLSVTWGCFLTEIDRTEIDRKQLCVGDMYILICLLTTCLQLIHVFTSIDYVGQCMFRVWGFCCN